MPFSLDRGGSIAHCASGVPVAVLARLGTYLHELPGGFVSVVAPVERRHAPNEVRAADIRAALAVIWRGALDAALIVGPPAFPNRVFVPPGNAKRNDARWPYRLDGSNQALRFQLVRRDNTAGDDIKDGDVGGSQVRICVCSSWCRPRGWHPRQWRRRADVILLLISPDFLASDYCYERETDRALERHGEGRARVIPVILRPCDWHDLPFGTLLAAPKDGRPVTKWPNIDEAFLDVVLSDKRALKELGQQPKRSAAPPIEDVSSAQETARSCNLRVKKQFTDLDKDRFRHEGFEYIAKFFENSLIELVSRNPGFNQAFRRIDAERFATAAYRDGKKVCRSSVSMGGGAMGRDGIEYSMTDEPRHGGINEALYVKADDQMLYFEALGHQFLGHDKEKLTFQGAAEILWDLFIRPLQV